MATIAGLVTASGDYDTNNADFDILKNAVIAAGLTAALDDTAADLTVFAPTDAAFISLATSLGFDGSDEADAFAYLVDALTLLSGGGDPIPLLADILRYHVLPQSLTAAELGGVTSVETLLGTDIGIDGTSLQDADPDVDDPQLVTTDIAADNGIIHAIDGVLLPLDLLQSNGANDVDLRIGDDGRDVIATGRDNDFISGKGGSDQLVAGGGDDVVLAGAGNDFVFGGKGNDVLNGDDGRDKIFAGRGDDTINGGADFDVVRGFKGNDVFVFEAGNDTDVILDFRRGVDQIDVSSFGVTSIDDLELTSTRSRTTIDFGDDELVILRLRHQQLDASDFIFA